MNIERRGRFYQLIKNSKKRKIDKEFNKKQEVKNQEMLDFIEEQRHEIEQMQEELEDYKQKLEDHSKDTDLLKNLYDRGYIDLDGNPINK